MTDVPTKNCPRCGQPPAMQLDPQQAFCGNGACDVLAWNPTQTVEALEATASIVDASKWEKE